MWPHPEARLADLSALLPGEGKDADRDPLVRRHRSEDGVRTGSLISSFTYRLHPQPTVTRRYGPVMDACGPPATVCSYASHAESNEAAR